MLAATQWSGAAGHVEHLRWAAALRARTRGLDQRGWVHDALCGPGSTITIATSRGADSVHGRCTVVGSASDFFGEASPPPCVLSCMRCDPDSCW